MKRKQCSLKSVANIASANYIDTTRGQLKLYHIVTQFGFFHISKQIVMCVKNYGKIERLVIEIIETSKKSDWLSSTLVKKKCKGYVLFDMTISSNVEYNRFCISKISWKDDTLLCQFTIQVSSDGSWLISSVENSYQHLWISQKN